MKIQTPFGLGEGMPMTDIQRNTFWLRILAIGVLSMFVFLVFMTWYIMHFDVVNTIVAELAGKK